MRLAKVSRTLLLLAVWAALVTCAAAQDHPNVQPSNVRDQLAKPPAPALSQPASAPVALKTPPPAQEAKAPAKAPAKTNPPAKAPVSQAPAKTPAPAKGPAKSAEKKAAKPPVEKPAEEKVGASRRDPFDPLVNKPSQVNATPQNLPPGKAGLVVGTLRVDGIVGGAHGMIAIVSNPQQRVYFLREGDKLYDGSVQHITIEAVSFQEFGKDAFGKPLERQVTKRLYPSPGEQQ
jgi:Tfp pilus assembly protein PilP